MICAALRCLRAEWRDVTQYFPDPGIYGAGYRRCNHAASDVALLTWHRFAFMKVRSVAYRLSYRIVSYACNALVIDSLRYAKSESVQQPTLSPARIRTAQPSPTRAKTFAAPPGNRLLPHSPAPFIWRITTHHSCGRESSQQGAAMVMVAFDQWKRRYSAPRRSAAMRRAPAVSPRISAPWTPSHLCQPYSYSGSHIESP
jgi:hypothetical protein